MFDGTDLSMAYGSSLGGDSMMGGMGGGGGSFLATPVQHTVQMPPPPQNTVTEQIMPSTPSTASHAMPPEVPYTPPTAMYTHQNKAMSSGGDNIWDKLSSKKYDVLKLVMLSLVILLAMSSDRIVNFYLSKYISGGLLSNMQEFLVRLSYPLVILLLLWMIKAMA
jgi:hypothetical protein